MVDGWPIDVKGRAGEGRMAMGLCFGGRGRWDEMGGDEMRWDKCTGGWCGDGDFRVGNG